MRHIPCFLLIVVLAVSTLACDSNQPSLAPELFEGTWINPAPDLEDNSQICRIDIIKYAGGYRIKRWNPGDHIQIVWTELPGSDVLSVQWDYAISTETLELRLLAPDRLEARRLHHFEEDRFTDREWQEFFEREEQSL